MLKTRQEASRARFATLQLPHFGKSEMGAPRPFFLM
jgi:hypothetical protein